MEGGDLMEPIRGEIFEGKRGWYYHLRHPNGEITNPSEPYASKANAKRALEDHLELEPGDVVVVDVAAGDD